MAAEAINEHRQDRNSLGKASFVLGLVALVLAFIPIIGFVSWLLAPLAIVFGLIALRRVSKSLAIVGIITGVIALFICYSWVSGAKAFGDAMNKDSFNNTGETKDLANAPIVAASIKGVWSDLESNKLAAGQKYGDHRLKFTGEKVTDIGGSSEAPTLSFIGKAEEYISYNVAATFEAGDANRIAELAKGTKVDFICQSISEGFGEGYSLSNCNLQ